MRTAILLTALVAGCGGAEATAPARAPTVSPGPRRPPLPPAFHPDEVVVASATGRIRSLMPLADGRWIASLLMGSGAVPGVLAPGASDVATPEGWSATGVIALRPSPDGSQVAFTKATDAANPEVWVRPLAGTDPGRRVSAGYFLSWMPDGAHVITLASTGTNFTAATLDVVEVAAGTARTVVPAAPGQLFRGAAASPDGSKIAFLRYPEAFGGVLEPSDVFVVPAAGGEPRQVTTDSAGCLDLAWTADGAWILHSAHRGADRDIWAVPAGGGRPVRVAGTASEDGVPAVSADGRALRWAVYDDARAKVLLYESGRTEPPRVLAEGGADRIQPSLSPDGFQIAYVISSANASNLVIGRVDDGSGRALTETTEPEALPVWAPDGSSLAYLSPREGGLEIVLHLFRAGDEGTRGSRPPQPIRAAEAPLTHGANVVAGRPPRFSPDGRSLAYLTTKNGQQALMVLPLGGGDPVEVAPVVLSFAWDPRLSALLVVRPKQGGGTELVRMHLDGRRRPEVLRVDPKQTWLIGPATDNAVFVLEEAARLRVSKLDLATGRRDPLVELPENVDPFRLGVDVSRDGRFVAASVAQVTTQVREMRNFARMPLD
ncbi:MAG: PD40 domain-containing protein [Deltaproteobacteria bacterium]|nr:PD40 domain-containing protein [Deltaproteobacteria bacterium]